MATVAIQSNTTIQTPDDPQIPQPDLHFASEHQRQPAKQQRNEARAQHKTRTATGARWGSQPHNASK